MAVDSDAQQSHGRRGSLATRPGELGQSQSAREHLGTARLTDPDRALPSQEDDKP